MTTTKPLPKKPVINPFEQLKNTPDSKVESTVISSSIFKEIPQVGPNATKLNFDQLNSAYAGQDKKSIEEIQKSISPDQKNASFKLKFFRQFKNDEEQYYLNKKRKEEEKKQQEEMEEQEKIKQQEQARLSQHADSDPKGKKKKNIFGKMRDIASTVLAPEQKPGGGKQ